MAKVGSGAAWATGLGFGGGGSSHWSFLGVWCFPAFLLCCWAKLRLLSLVLCSGHPATGTNLCVGFTEPPRPLPPSDPYLGLRLFNHQFSLSDGSEDCGH